MKMMRSHSDGEEKNTSIVEDDDAQNPQTDASFSPAQTPDSVSPHNPAPPPDLDLEMLRGDRIGDTVYSGKWCIETVMKLMQSNAIVKNGSNPDQPESNMEMAEQSETNREMRDQSPPVVDMDEDLQNQVGALWDMTSNEEVCEFLHSIGAIESIYEIISYSRCPRATELCAGILANVVSHDSMWAVLADDTTLFNTMIHQLTNTDQPTLLEVARFFSACLSHRQHTVCYSSLWASEGLVCQEVTRILSGSTNAELLQQTASLTLTLLTLDSDESQFCVSLAHPALVTAVVEASGEIGYGQVSCAQDVLLDVLYQLTTYTDGAQALETSLHAIGRACSSYLHTVCRCLSLSNHAGTLTCLVALLDHVYCRSLAVQRHVYDAPQVVGHMLKVLVTVYRRQGLYSLISDSQPGFMSPAPQREASSWGDTGDTPTKLGSRSWSERAGERDGTGKTPTQTPDASPMTGGQQVKDLDVSWSERRVGTPQATASTPDEVWKRPLYPRKGRRSPTKKESQPRRTEEGESESQGGTGEENSSSSMEELDGKQCHTFARAAEATCSQILDKCDVGSRDVERSKNEQISNGNNKARRNSLGFSPSDTDDQSLKHDQKGEVSDNYFDRCDSSERVKNLKISSLNEVTGSESPVNGSGDVCTGVEPHDSRFDSDGDDDTQAGQCEESMADSTEPYQGHKYTAMREAVQEFLQDFVQALSKKALQIPIDQDVENTLRYLDKRCRSTELRALFRYDHSPGLKGHLKVILDASERLKARHLLSILTVALKGW